MPYHRATVDIITPNWGYCDVRNPYNPKYKVDERCRFCKEIKKRGQLPRFQCIIFNVELETKNNVVCKTPLCIGPWEKNKILDLTKEPKPSEPDVAIEPKDLGKTVKQVMKKIERNAKTLLKNGIPAEQAYNIAIDQVSQDWK